MARRSRKEIVVFSLSFLDCICCGFGAVILLMVMNRGMSQKTIEQTEVQQEEILTIAEDETFLVEGTMALVEIELDAVREQQATAMAQRDALQQRQAALLTEFTTTADYSSVLEAKQHALAKVLQERDELRRLPPPWRVDLVGGIPADSEYVVFVIDTSGSIAKRAKTVANALKETFEVYPEVKGIQAIDADGDYFLGEPGKWISGDAGGREMLLGRIFHVLQGIHAERFRGSGSLPVAGILRAVRDFGLQGKDVSIYVFGDDFTEYEAVRAWFSVSYREKPSDGTIAYLLTELDRLNPRDVKGQRRVRIHAIGLLTEEGQPWKFAQVMRVICHRFDGAFVGLTD